MEKIKRNGDGKMRRGTRLASAFAMYVFGTFMIVVLLSGVVITGCYLLQRWLLPESDEVFLNIEKTYADGSTEVSGMRMTIDGDMNEELQLVNEDALTEELEMARYSLTSVESGFSMLSPKRKLLYRCSEAAMILFPVAFSFAGIVLCSYFFYKKKLEPPITVLSQAADRIAEQDLDFEIVCSSGDELGALCGSFEVMRRTLRENNRRMWDMLEERRYLQASVAHDLRNPITIIEGHAQYLRFNLPEGRLDMEQILSIAGNIEHAAMRLERYTESIRTVNHLEELEPEYRSVDFAQLCEEMTADLTRITGPCGRTLQIENAVKDTELVMDAQLLYRMLENLLGNAVRYARQEIRLSFACSEQLLTVRVTDDGPGYPDKILKHQERYDFAANAGMGLIICRILCKRHGGRLTLSNRECGGACAELKLLCRH